MLEHPQIGWIERTGYPSWLQEPREWESDGEWEEEPIWLDQSHYGSRNTTGGRLESMPTPVNIAAPG